MHFNVPIILKTGNGLSLTAIPLRPLFDDHVLVFCQDRLTVAKLESPNYCNEVKTMDIIHFYEDHLTKKIPKLRYHEE